MAAKEKTQRDNLIENSLLLLALAILLIACFRVILPFLGIFIYAIIIATAMWAPFEWLTSKFGGRRKIAAVVFILAFMLVLAIPFAYMASSMGYYFHQSSEILHNIRNNGLPPLPEWISSLPFIGSEIQGQWELLRTDTAHQLSLYEPQLSGIARWVLGLLGGLLGATVEIIAGIFLAAFILLRGDKMKHPLHELAEHLFGAQGSPAILNAAHRAIKGVAVGVLGASILGAMFSWIGFSIAGLPSAMILAGLVFVLMMTQIGPLPVLIPLVIWLFWQGQHGNAIFLSIYGILVLVAIDSLVKPWIIARTGKLPIFILLVGVLGGLAAWGFTGMFIGAISLSVFYTVMQTWITLDSDDSKIAAQ